MTATMRTSQMSEAKSTSNQEHNHELLCAVLDQGEIALVRVTGRGSFSNSVAFKDFVDKVQEVNPEVRIILDLDECQSMDSTFMGVLAGIAIKQMQKTKKKVKLVNVSDHCAKLLKNLGVSSLVDLRKESSSHVDRAEASFQPAEMKQVDRTEQICLTLQAHKQLVDLDEQNEVRFQAVIEYLEKSLHDEGC